MNWRRSPAPNIGGTFPKARKGLRPGPEALAAAPQLVALSAILSFTVYGTKEERMNIYECQEVLSFATDEKTAYVNVRFTDLVGAWHHLTFPIDELSEKSFEEGFGFDGSSLRGWASIHESDMLLVPDPCRYWVESFHGGKDSVPGCRCR
jgi:hypothetical protein